MPENLERPQHSFVRWKIMAVICGASFVSYVLRTNLSVIGETMMKDLHFSLIELGFVFSAFALGYAIFQFPGGVAGDVFGTRKSITAFAVRWGILTIITGLVPAPNNASVTTILVFLIVVRFLVGATHAPIFPVVGGAIGNWFPMSSWGLPNGLTTTAYTLGAAATAPLLVWLMGLTGWRNSFFITSILGFLIAAIWWKYLRDYPVEHSGVSRQEMELIDAGREPPLKSGEAKQGWKHILKDRNIWMLTLSYFCMNYVFYLFFTWFFTYLVDVRKIPQKEAGILTAVQWIAGAVGALLGGYVCDRCAKRFGPRWGYRLLPLPSLILAGAFLIIGAYTTNSYVAVLLFSLSFALTQVTDPFYWAASVSIAGRHATAAGGVLNTGGNAVGFVGAILVPFTAQNFGWEAAVGTGTVFAVLSAVLWLAVKSDAAMATT